MRITHVVAILLITNTTTNRAQAPTPVGAPRPPAGPQMRGDGPAPAPKPFSITRSEPGLDAIVSAGAKLELIASGPWHQRRVHKIRLKRLASSLAQTRHNDQRHT